MMIGIIHTCTYWMYEQITPVSLVYNQLVAVVILKVPEQQLYHIREWWFSPISAIPAASLVVWVLPPVQLLIKVVFHRWAVSQTWLFHLYRQHFLKAQLLVPTNHRSQLLPTWHNLCSTLALRHQYHDIHLTDLPSLLPHREALLAQCCPIHLQLLVSCVKPFVLLINCMYLLFVPWLLVEMFWSWSSPVVSTQWILFNVAEAFLHFKDE